MFAGFLIISVLFELALHAIEHRLEHKNRHGLLAFVQGLKTEVLLYGLLSLLLSVVQSSLAGICVPAPGYGSTDAPAASYGRRLLKYASNCGKGEKQLLSYKTAYNIHVLIFMVAVSHIFMALLSLSLCLLKVGKAYHIEAAIKKHAMRGRHTSVRYADEGFWYQKGKNGPR